MNLSNLLKKMFQTSIECLVFEANKLPVSERDQQLAVAAEHEQNLAAVPDSHFEKMAEQWKYHLLPVDDAGGRYIEAAGVRIKFHVSQSVAPRPPR